MTEYEDIYQIMIWAFVKKQNASLNVLVKSKNSIKTAHIDLV